MTLRLLMTENVEPRNHEEENDNAMHKNTDKCDLVGARSTSGVHQLPETTHVWTVVGGFEVGDEIKTKGASTKYSSVFFIRIFTFFDMIETE